MLSDCFNHSAGKHDRGSYHSAGKNDRRSYIHYTINPLYYLPPLLFTPFTIIPPILLSPLNCFSGIKTHGKKFIRHILSSKHSNSMSKK